MPPHGTRKVGGAISQKGLVMKLKTRMIGFAASVWLLFGTAQAQMIDNTQAPNTAKAGINKSLLDEIGAGRGDVMTAGSSVYIINRDPFRSIRRGRHRSRSTRICN